MVNRLKTLSKEFQSILRETSRIGAGFGYPVYLVGGVVRDLLLRRPVYDFDIVVEGDAIGLARELAAKLGAAFCRHHSFGTATVTIGRHRIDFATARTEHYTHWGALPRVKPSTLTEDLRRRDFTINALAISLNKDDWGRMLECSRGLDDLDNGLLRVLHDKSFLEDPTRILRAIRFEQRFSFKLEENTFNLFTEAFGQNALGYVSQHRLRDELVLLLREPEPRRVIRRIDSLVGFCFLHPELGLTREHYALFSRIEAAISHYQKKYRKHRPQQAWLIYLAAILMKLSAGQLTKLLSDYAFRKGERLIIQSITAGLGKVKVLTKNLKPYAVYRLLNEYSFEALLFFYAYYPQVKIRRQIDYFFSELSGIRLSVRGKDLKQLNLSPDSLYGELLRQLLCAKINKGLGTKKKELQEAKAIFHRLSRSFCPRSQLGSKNCGRV